MNTESDSTEEIGGEPARSEEKNDPVNAGADVAFVYGLYEKVRLEIQKVIIGNDELIKYTLAAMFSGGHVLLEGVPGVAKTMTAKLISQCMNLNFRRIQFTPDLLPSDLIGVTLFNMQKT